MILPRVPRTSKEKSKSQTEEVKAEQIENILETNIEDILHKMTTKSNVQKASTGLKVITKEKWLKWSCTGFKSQSAEKGVDGGSDHRGNGATAWRASTSLFRRLDQLGSLNVFRFILKGMCLFISIELRFKTYFERRNIFEYCRLSISLSDPGTLFEFPFEFRYDGLCRITSECRSWTFSSSGLFCPQVLQFFGSVGLTTLKMPGIVLFEIRHCKCRDCTDWITFASFFLVEENSYDLARHWTETCETASGRSCRPGSHH